MIDCYIENCNDYLHNRFLELYDVRVKNHKLKILSYLFVIIGLIGFIIFFSGLYSDDIFFIIIGILLILLGILFFSLIKFNCIRDPYKDYKDFLNYGLSRLNSDYSDKCLNIYKSGNKLNIFDYSFGRVVYMYNFMIENNYKVEPLYLIDNTTAITEYKGRCIRLKLDAIVYCSQRESNLVLLDSGNFKLLIGVDKKGFIDLRCS